jgi:DNA segregation ATPase FtsK/SpoIIIE-like protein
MQIDTANLDARIALRCSSFHSSNVILGRGDAFRLRDKGDMIFRSPEYSSDLRLKSSYISKEDMPIRLSNMDLDYECDKTFKYTMPENGCVEASHELNKKTKADRFNEALAVCIMWSLEHEEIATSVHIIGKCGMAYPTASKVMDRLYNFGFVGEARPNKPRKTVPKTIEDVSNSVEVMEILAANGFSIEDVAEAIRKKSSLYI